MKYAELYNKAADLIEKGWTQNAFATNEYGDDVSPNNNKATSWCLSGALWLVVHKNRVFNETSKDRVTINYKLIKDLKLGDVRSRME